MKKIRFGVIGLNFGRQHVRTLANLEEVELAAIADKGGDSLPGGLEGYAQTYGARAYRDGAEMLENEQLDAVCLCTSPRSRAGLIEIAIRRGMALFVEKPWATDVEHAQRLIDLCRASQAPVMTAFSFRYHPAIVRLRELIAGELGPALLLNAEYAFNWTPVGWLWDPQDGNGFFNENSCHLFDSVLSLAGDPDAVSAEAINPFGAPSEHAAALALRFKSGAVAALTIGGIASGGFHNTPRIDVITANGQAHLEGRDHIWEEVRWNLRGSPELHNLTLPPEQLGSTRYTDALRHFIACIRTGQKPQTGPLEGLKSVALAMAVYESARTGKRVDVRWD
jgi:predicted dehydrogenase